MSQSLALYQGPASGLIEDYGPRATAATFATNEHGFAESRVSVPMRLIDAFRVYDRPGLPELALYDGAQTIHVGRLEDVALSQDGINVSAYGYSRALSDAPYTALWSASGVADWRVLTTSDNTGAPSEKFASDTSNRLYLAAKKNETFANTIIGLMGYVTPSLGSRQIVGISFAYEFKAPVNWQFFVQRRDSAWVTVATDVTINGTGAVLSGTRNYTFAGTNNLTFGLFYNAASAVYAGETGDCYFKITSLRIVTTTTNRIDTTLTVNRAAGVNVTATVGSTARMYVGQQLSVSNVAGTVGEMITVLSIGGPTIFNATFTNAYVIGDIIRAHVVYADEIAADLVATVAALNSTQLSSSTALIQSPGVDLLNEVYEDRAMDDILDYLVGLGDNQTPPNQWEWGVWEDQRLHFRPRGTNAREWYADATELEIERTLSQLYNSIYATYQEAGGRTLRTAATSDTASGVRYGLTRRQQIDVQSTSSTQAGVQQAAALEDGKDPIPRAGLALTAVYDAAGSRWPLFMIRSGDTITIRNVPPTVSSDIDRIRTFRIARTTYDALNGTIQVEPESPLPTLSALLARA